MLATPSTLRLLGLSLLVIAAAHLSSAQTATAGSRPAPIVGKQDVRVAVGDAAADPRIAALEKTVEELRKEIQTLKQEASASKMLLTGLDKSVGALKTDYQNHVHRVNGIVGNGTDGDNVVIRASGGNADVAKKLQITTTPMAKP